MARVGTFENIELALMYSLDKLKPGLGQNLPALIEKAWQLDPVQWKRTARETKLQNLLEPISHFYEKSTLPSDSKLDVEFDIQPHKLCFVTIISSEKIFPSLFYLKIVLQFLTINFVFLITARRRRNHFSHQWKTKRLMNYPKHFSVALDCRLILPRTDRRPPRVFGDHRVRRIATRRIKKRWDNQEINEPIDQSII